MEREYCLTVQITMTLPFFAEDDEAADEIADDIMANNFVCFIEDGSVLSSNGYQEDLEIDHTVRLLEPVV